MFSKILSNVREKSPLVHNITNYVTVNDVANIIKNYMANGEGSTVDNAYEFAKENSLTNLGKELERAYTVLLEEAQ